MPGSIVVDIEKQQARGAEGEKLTVSGRCETGVWMHYRAGGNGGYPPEREDAMVGETNDFAFL